MAYIYLLDLYKMIDQRIEAAEAAMGDLSDNPVEQQYHEGRITALSDFKAYLTVHFNPKLPGRIRARHKFKN